MINLLQTTASNYRQVFQANGESTPGSFVFDGPFVVQTQIWPVADVAQTTRHHLGYKNFEYYYTRLVFPQMKTYFPE